MSPALSLARNRIPLLPPPSIADQLRPAEAELKAHRSWLFERHSRRGRSEFMKEVNWLCRQSMLALERELRANPPGTVRWDML